jgi:hypothetical protein
MRLERNLRFFKRNLRFKRNFSGVTLHLVRARA